jgi:ubiquinol-cytochrome c reductase cytochrome b subunit
VLGVTIPPVLIPGVIIPGIAFGIMTLWPFLERYFTKDASEHNLLDRPRDNPVRTGLGVAGLLFFVMLTVAAGNDVAAIIIGVPVETMTDVLRFGVILVPIAGYFITHRICVELQRSEGHPLARGPAVRLRRTAEGGFEEIDESSD